MKKRQKLHVQNGMQKSEFAWERNTLTLQGLRPGSVIHYQEHFFDLKFGTIRWLYFSLVNSRICGLVKWHDTHFFCWPDIVSPVTCRSTIQQRSSPANTVTRCGV